MAEGEKSQLPPYATYRSFSNLISDLREGGIPTHISRSVVKGSNSGKAMMSASLKALGLINEDTTPTPTLRKLVGATDKDEYAAALKDVLTAAYPFMFDGTINLAHTTSEVVAEKFKGAGATGSTVTKCVQFFLSAAKESGVKVSSRVKPPTPTRNGSTKPKPRKPRSAVDPLHGGEAERPSSEMIRIPIPLHGLQDGAILLPQGMSKKSWDHAKKMARFILDNYRQDFDDEEGT